MQTDEIRLTKKNIAKKEKISVRTLERWVDRNWFPSPDFYVNGIYPRWNYQTYQEWLDKQHQRGRHER